MKIVLAFSIACSLLCHTLTLKAQENSWTELPFPAKNNEFGGPSLSTDDAAYYCELTDVSNPFPMRFFKFNPTTQVWSQGPNLPADDPIFAFGIGTKAYVGFKNRSFYYYDPANNNWHALSNYPMESCAVAFPFSTDNPNSGLSLNNKGYVGTSNSYYNSAGQCISGTQINLWEYNPTVDSWTSKAIMGTFSTLRQNATIMKIGQKIYAGLGNDVLGNDYVDFWEFAPSTNTWTRKADFSGGAKQGAAGFEFCNKGYIVGGSLDYSVWKYDPSTNGWTKHSPNIQNASTGQFYQLQYSSNFTIAEKAYFIPMPTATGKMLQYTPFSEFKTSTIAGAPFCPGDALNVPFTMCGGLFNPGNVFKVELSNSSGSFASPTIIGTLTSTATQASIAATIPAPFQNGNLYRMRVVSTNPMRTSTNNGTDIIIRIAPTVTSGSPTISYITDPAFSITNVFPIGGTFTGPGMINGGKTFSPAAAGIGTHTLTYTFNSCSPTVQTKIVVLDCSSSGPWTQKTNFSVLIREHISATVGTKAYATTGTSGNTLSYFKELWEYDHTANTWTNKNSPFPGAGRVGATSFVIGSKMYVGGGQNYPDGVKNDFYVWNQANNTWNGIAPIPETLVHAVGFSINGFGYVVTGATNPAPGNIAVYPQSLWRYNPTLNVWDKMANYPGIGRACGAGFVVNNKAYVGVGYRYAVADYKDFYAYEPSNNSWIAVADYPEKNHWGVAAVRNNKGYVHMGIADSGPLPTSSYGYEYDPLINSWTKQLDLPSHVRWRASAFSLSNKIFILGGLGPALPIGDANTNELWQLGECDQKALLNFPAQSVICAGISVNIPVALKGPFNTNNVFTAQLSDANGNFGSPLTVGAQAYTAINSMPITIPANIPLGNGYRLRLTSSDPMITGADNGFDIAVTQCGITTLPISPLSFCAGSPVTVSFNVTPGFSDENTQYTLELSDANGVFSPATFMSSTSVLGLNKTVVTQIPVNAVAGSGYRIRARMGNVIYGTDNGTDIVIDNNCIGLALDGTNDQVTVPHHAGYNLGTGDFTLEGWIKLSSTQPNVNPVIVAKRSTASNGFMLRATSSGTKLEFSANGSTSLSSTFTTIFDNNCHHFAVTRSASTLSFYIDGTLKGTASISASINSSTSALNFGADAVSGNYAKGNINEIRFWNVAKSASQISSAKNYSYTAPTTNLIGCWNFKELNSQTVIDASANLNNGYLGSLISADIQDPARNGSFCFQYDRIGEFEETEFSTLQLFPNPFSETINVKIETEGMMYQYEIISMNGTRVGNGTLNSNNGMIYGGQLIKGVYQLHLTSNNGDVQVLKIVKL